MFLFNSHYMNVRNADNEKEDEKERKNFAVNYLMNYVITDNDNLAELEGVVPVLVTKPKAIF